MINIRAKTSNRIVSTSPPRLFPARLLRLSAQRDVSIRAALARPTVLWAIWEQFCGTRRRRG